MWGEMEWDAGWDVRWDAGCKGRPGYGMPDAIMRTEMGDGMHRMGCGIRTGYDAWDGMRGVVCVWLGALWWPPHNPATPDIPSHATSHLPEAVCGRPSYGMDCRVKASDPSLSPIFIHPIRDNDFAACRGVTAVMAPAAVLCVCTKSSGICEGTFVTRGVIGANCDGSEIDPRPRLLCSSQQHFRCTPCTREPSFPKRTDDRRPLHHPQLICTWRPSALTLTCRRVVHRSVRPLHLPARRAVRPLIQRAGVCGDQFASAWRVVTSC